MSIEKTFQGAWKISDLVNGRLVTRMYFFYTKREAVREFRQDIKELED